MKKIILTIGVCGLLFLNACKNDTVQPTPKAVAYVLNENGKITWKGKAANGRVNEGTINVLGRAAGAAFDFEVLNGEIKNGEFNIPVSSIEATNLQPVEKPILEAHLKTADFFFMAVHPVVKFKVISGKPATTNDPNANYLIKGEMTLLGSTHPLEFPAKVVIADGKLQIIASFTFNRSTWGMNYHLDSSYPDADRILPGIDVNFDLTAKVK